MNQLEKRIITKIEGHGKVNINLAQKKAKLEIDEGERLFEGLVIGRPYNDAPYITSRICGVCPTSHLLASIKAIESAFQIQPDERTILLRRLILAGQICQSHILHLYFLALPDYLKIQSSLDMPEKFPEQFANGIKLKRLFDEFIEIIGGRAVHPLTPTIGGFTKLPTANQLYILRDKLEDNLEVALETIKLFAGFHYPIITRETEMMALKNDETYPMYDGIVWTSEGEGFAPSNYQNEIEEIVKNNSSAKFSIRKNKYKNGFIVGSRARMAMFADYLNPKTKKEYLASSGKIGPANPFFNNLAQAIEVTHFMEESIILIDKIASLINENITFKVIPKAGIGTGAVEAPRGILYHQYEFDSNGKIIRADIITPTAQNLTSIEDDIEALLLHATGLENDRIEKLVNMLIRAFDPCITCSVH
ncbi:MAG: Ni/Fe hydrogenase subunit alpha [Patescibacteria group bacterium]|jgi:coenzyme F420-reducing hydrogenase alpha subunit